MSDSDDILSPAEIQIQLNFNYYCAMIAFTILFYDYLLTFQWEVQRYWGSRLSWSSFYFVFNRYFVMFGHIPVVMEYFWTTNATNKLKICHSLQSYHQYFAVISQIMVAIILMTRTYALYDRSRYVLALTIAVAVGAIILGTYVIVSQPSTVVELNNLPLFIGCPSAVAHAAAIRFAEAWCGLLVYDALIVVLTLYKSLTLWRIRGLSLITVLMRDGVLFFAVMCISNLLNILSFVLGGPFIRGSPTSFTNIMSSIMVSRLALNLRDPKLASRHSTTRSSRTYTYPVMTTVADPTNFTEDRWTHMEDDPGAIELAQRTTFSV